jgi:hypothetical protein
MKEPIGKRFCRCIKKVRKTVKVRPKSSPEQGAIAICVKSVLHRKNKTIKKFNCSNQNKPKIVLQKYPIMR